MKRLLAYLFIVFSLLLTLSVNSYSAVYCVDDKIDERIANFKPDYPTRENEFFYFSAQSGACIGSYTQVTYEQYNYFKNLFTKEKWEIKKKIKGNYSNYQFCSNYVNATRYFIQNKGKPNFSDSSAGADISNKAFNKKRCEKEYSLEKFVNLFLYRGKIDNPTEVKLKNNLNTLYSEFKRENLDLNIVNNIIRNSPKLNNYIKFLENKETQIAKAEPSQTQKVTETVSLQLNKNEVDAIFSSVNSCWSIPLGLPYNQDLSVKIKVKFDPSGNAIRTEIIDHAKINKKGNAYLKVLAESALRAIKLCSPIRAPKDKYDLWKEVVFNFDAKDVLNGTESNDTKIAKNNLLKKYTETQIAKAESTVTPKKKAKVAKVEDSTQEEFKPENKDIDNDAPIIEIAQYIIVDSQTYTLKGKVKDKSRFQLTIDDRPIKVAKNGQFEFEGFAIESKEQLKIVAIDRWKNKTEKKVNVEVKIKQVADLRSYEKPNPSKIKVKKDNNKIGIIIGIEKYQNLNNIDAPYANRDAKAFKAYANIALGIPNNNLKVLIDEDATRGELLKSLKIWLPQITRGKEKDIYIFFAGHGLASDNGEDLHILPHNGDPILLEDTALSRVEMFDLINKVSPKSVTMFFDTCYSGQTRSEQMLVAGLRPVRIVANEQDTPNNFTIFTASNYDQTSGSINEAEHGIFSYYLMKGLDGKADENSDKKITNGELISYLKNNVTQEAFTQNRSQEPMLVGDPDKVLISYR